MTRSPAFLLIGVMACLSGCGQAAAPPSPYASQAAKASVAAPASAPSPATVNPFKADGAAWERFKEAAKSEGAVEVAGPPFPGLRSGVVETFQKDYGIQADYVALYGGELISRVDREAKTGKPTLDVNIGGVSGCWTMAERNQIDDAVGLVVDPSLFAPNLWWDGHIRPILPSPKMPANFYCGMQTAAWVMTDLFVNTQAVPLESVTSWKDLLKPEYKGKIASFDPRVPGSSQTTVGYLSALFGDDYVKNLYANQQAVLTTDYRQLSEWVARGTYPIGIGLNPGSAEMFRSQGLPLQRLFPADGPGALTGGFGTIMKIRGGPHPNAAAVFMNWWASKAGQEVYEAGAGEATLRTDVAHDKVPAYIVPQRNVTYAVDDYDPSYYFATRAPAISKLSAALGR